MSVSAASHLTDRRVRAGVGASAASTSGYSAGTARRKPAMPSSGTLETLWACSFSVLSSVSIVIANKYLISTLGFKYVTTLTSWHLFMTAGFLHVMRLVGRLEPKQIETKALITFGVLNGMSIGLLNLALGYNSVGFYQMTKLAIIPFTVTLQSTFYGKSFSTMVKLSLAVLLLGVGIATVTDIELNLLGSIISALAIVCTCVTQIWTNTLQKSQACSSTQLLYASAPLQGVTLFVIGVPLDAVLTNGDSFLAYDYTTYSTMFVVLSCSIAIAVNYSTFLVIGKCDAVTYQVLGHLKTCIILVLGFTMLGAPTNSRNVFGISVAVVGMMLYAHYEHKDQQARKVAANKEDPDVEAGSHSAEGGSSK